MPKLLIYYNFIVFTNIDNELDKTQTRLEVAEKKFKEKSKAFIEAKEEAVELKKQIQIKEERLKKVNEQFNSQNGTLTNSSTRYELGHLQQLTTDILYKTF